MTTVLENHINFIAFNLAVIALRWSSVITFAGAPSTIAYILDFPWNISISFFRISDDTKPALTLANPNFAFIFTIIGIDKPDNPDKISYLMKIN